MRNTGWHAQGPGTSPFCSGKMPLEQVDASALDPRLLWREFLLLCFFPSRKRAWTRSWLRSVRSGPVLVVSGMHYQYKALGWRVVWDFTSHLHMFPCTHTVGSKQKALLLSLGHSTVWFPNVWQEHTAGSLCLFYRCGCQGQGLLQPGVSELDRICRLLPVGRVISKMLLKPVKAFSLFHLLS